MPTAEQRPLSRDLLGALGWAAFIAFGAYLGLFLGSLGSDVPADAAFLVTMGLLAGAATLVVRVLMVGISRRGRTTSPGQGRAYRPRPERSRIAGAAPYRPRPVDRTVGPDRPPATPERPRGERPRPPQPKPAVSARQPAPAKATARPTTKAGPKSGDAGTSAKKPTAKKGTAPTKQVAKSAGSPTPKPAAKPARKKPPDGGAKKR